MNRSNALPVPFQGQTFDSRRHVRAWRVYVKLRATLARVDENTITVEIDHAAPGGAYRHALPGAGDTSRVFYAGRKRISYKALRAALPRDVEPPKRLYAGDVFEFETNSPLYLPSFGYSQPSGTCVVDTFIFPAKGWQEPADALKEVPIAWIKKYGITIEF